MLILLTGGSACGKSHYAEQLCTALPGPRYYIAAMQPFGADGAAKIQRHRQLRAGKGFQTIERYTGLDGLVLPERGTALLECVCNLTANEMFDDAGRQSDPCQRVLQGVEALARQCRDLVVVTNDVGSDGGEYEQGTRDYITALGRINALLAARADAVRELVCGIPIPMKGGGLPGPAQDQKGGDGMILVVGGEGSGKRRFARSLGYGDGDMADGVLDERPVLFHLERLADGLSRRDPASLEALPAALAGKKLVLCNEVGSGVIPATPEARHGREAVGRLCVRLAQQADTVVRMVCGIPTVLKGEINLK